MTRKTTKRKLSQVVADAVADATVPFEHLTAADRAQLVAKAKESRVKADALSDRIKVILQLGVRNAERGYSDKDVERLVAARDMSERERRRPEDFVSAGVFNAAQRSNRGKAGTGPSYDHDEIRKLATRKGYFSTDRGRERSAIRREIVAELRLDVDRGTSAESWQRTLRRILDGK